MRSPIRFMASTRARTNPFYVLLVVVGIVFSLTAMLYFILMLNQMEGRHGELSGVLHFMDKYGMRVMMLEIGVLAVATVGAIGTEHIWNPETTAERNVNSKEPSKPKEPSVAPSTDANAIPQSRKPS